MQTDAPRRLSSANTSPRPPRPRQRIHDDATRSAGGIAPDEDVEALLPVLEGVDGGVPPCAERADADGVGVVDVVCDVGGVEGVLGARAVAQVDASVVGAGSGDAGAGRAPERVGGFVVALSSEVVDGVVDGALGRVDVVA